MPNSSRLLFLSLLARRHAHSCARPSVVASLLHLCVFRSFPARVSIWCPLSFLPLYYYLCRICCLRGLSCCDELSQCISTVREQ
ncbi:hypothetical protein C8T65DRAFT_179996 [Cerioporus squamosus]|nr:hypothetical protein C8T65DRAFT_179996 [Cerioporus squamosus]